MAQGKKTVNDNEIVATFREATDPVFSAAECAGLWNMSEQGARNRLEKLVADGVLEKKKPGSRTAVYWLPEP
jgi:Fic family protein